MKNLCTFIFSSALLVTHLFGQNIYTPKGTLVPTNSYFQYNLTQSQLNALDDDVENGLYGPTPIIISNSSNAYNCHGYAWNTYPSKGREVALDDPTW